ncbi:hypothetical protein GCM10027422_34530 [Hymenobacter arcticus]
MIRFLVILLSISTLAHGQQSRKRLIHEFEYHFKILDSLSIISENEIIENCFYSIRFMESATGIEAATGGNYVGKFDCYKSDLYKWHEWYRSIFIYKKRYKKVSKSNYH